MNITYTVERWKDLNAEMAPFAPLHWAELAVTKEEVPLDLDWERFNEIDNAGKLHTVIVRDNGVMIGYHVTLVGPHLHYKSTLHGMVDLYYVLPEYRKHKVGLGLFSFAERSLKQLGVVKIITGTKCHLPNDSLFEHLGYVNTDRTYAKAI